MGVPPGVPGGNVHNVDITHPDGGSVGEFGFVVNDSLLQELQLRRASQKCSTGAQQWLALACRFQHSCKVPMFIQHLFLVTLAALVPVNAGDNLEAIQ